MTFVSAEGVFPTMITPFTSENRIDWEVVDQLVEYYVKSGCAGVFAVCQSSEMFYLSEREKSDLTRRVVRQAAGRLQVVASGHTSDDPDEQIRELASAAEAGADVAVIVLNRLAARAADEEEVRKNLLRILKALPGVPLGVYECPYPYKRLASSDLMKFMADTGRISFVKDTSCDLETLRARYEAVKDTPLTIYNANTTTLLDSLRMGVRGYSGVMANFHADLYVKLFELHRRNDARADLLQAFLTTAAFIERQLYPINAKYHLAHNHIHASLMTRSRDVAEWNPTYALEVDHLALMEEAVRKALDP